MAPRLRRIPRISRLRRTSHMMRQRHWPRPPLTRPQREKRANHLPGETPERGVATRARSAHCGRAATRAPDVGLKLTPAQNNTVNIARDPIKRHSATSHPVTLKGSRGHCVCVATLAKVTRSRHKCTQITTLSKYGD
ncbi:hypothetical protein AAFF_G00324110 [Aldrovandia affinis]|uniref:Uncharacterized protein n=1 Tax=Aldrovandia affinis TaxID=143900 RepID=A0AAD7R7E5_9TELE|nr:hypothetical protein AAFF_G00324110 [Aldrovandia affinis]